MRYSIVKIFLLLFFSLSFFSYAHAALRITEIMYAPNTSEDEWVEIFNDGSEAVDIGKWIINDGTNHALENSVPIPAGGRVIVADSKDAFSAVYPSVPVFSVSALSFNDGGDTVVLKDTKGVVYDSISYTTSPSALKNGKSLQLYGSSFYAGMPSPGKETAESIQSESAAASSTSSSSSNNAAQTGAVTYLTPYRPWPADQYMYASFGGPKVGVAGGEISFEGRLISAEKKPVPAADLYWTFGDGGMEKGKNVKHIYKYPGEYYAILTATYGENIAEDMAKITVIAPDISITRTLAGPEGFIEIFNETKEVLDLSGWVLEQGGVNGLHFAIPKNTKIFGDTKVIFPSDITKLNLSTTTVALYFPNNKKVSEYNGLGEVVVTQDSLGTKSTVTPPTEEALKEDVVYDVYQKASVENDSPESFLKEEIQNPPQVQTQKEVSKIFETSSSSENIQPAATGAKEQSSSLKILALYGILSLIIILFIVLISFKEKEEAKVENADSYEIIE